MAGESQEGLIGRSLEALYQPRHITLARGDGGLFPSSIEVSWTVSTSLIGSGDFEQWKLRPA